MEYLEKSFDEIRMERECNSLKEVFLLAIFSWGGLVVPFNVYRMYFGGFGEPSSIFSLTCFVAGMLLLVYIRQYVSPSNVRFLQLLFFSVASFSLVYDTYFDLMHGRLDPETGYIRDEDNVRQWGILLFILCFFHMRNWLYGLTSLGLGSGILLASLYFDGNPYFIALRFFSFVALSIYLRGMTRGAELMFVSLEELVRANMELTRQRDAFFSQASHEIRTPLHGIIASIDMILQDGQLPPSLREEFNVLRLSTRQLFFVANEMLDFERIRQRRLVLNQAPADVVAMMEQIRRMFLASCMKHNCTIDVRHQGLRAHEERWRRLDSTRVIQVLSNLINNAISCSEHVSLTVEARENSRLHFAVQDDGPGLGPEDAERIFTPFSGVGGATRPNEESSFMNSGLGLSICKELVGIMGGTLRVETAPGRGSTFCFDIDAPFGKALRPTQGEEGTDDLGSLLSPLCVMIVDDNALNLMLLKRMCLKILPSGSQVLGFSNGGDAVTYLESHLDLRDPIKLVVFMDFHLPDGTGVSFCLKMRSIIKDREILNAKIIFMSASSGFSEYQLRYFDEVLPKPFRFQSLQRIFLEKNF